jgi:hypothetical protein
MVKVGLWLGSPTVVTFLASAQTMRLENTLLIFTVALIALFLGFGPGLSDKGGR